MCCIRYIFLNLLLEQSMYPPRLKAEDVPSSGAELSAELPPSELPDAVALLTFFFVAFFFSDPFAGLTFFLPLVPPTVH